MTSMYSSPEFAVSIDHPSNTIELHGPELITGWDGGLEGFLRLKDGLEVNQPEISPCSSGVSSMPANEYSSEETSGDEQAAEEDDEDKDDGIDCSSESVEPNVLTEVACNEDSLPDYLSSFSQWHTVSENVTCTNESQQRCSDLVDEAGPSFPIVTPTPVTIQPPECSPAISVEQSNVANHQVSNLEPCSPLLNSTWYNTQNYGTKEAHNPPQVQQQPEPPAEQCFQRDNRFVSETAPQSANSGISSNSTGFRSCSDVKSEVTLPPSSVQPPMSSPMPFDETANHNTATSWKSGAITDTKQSSGMSWNKQYSRGNPNHNLDPNGRICDLPKAELTSVPHYNHKYWPHYVQKDVSMLNPPLKSHNINYEQLHSGYYPSKYPGSTYPYHPLLSAKPIPQDQYNRDVNVPHMPAQRLPSMESAFLSWRKRAHQDMPWSANEMTSPHAYREVATEASYKAMDPQLSLVSHQSESHQKGVGIISHSSYNPLPETVHMSSASQFASSIASLSQISPTEKDLGSHNPCWPTSQKGLSLISHSSYNPLPEPAHMSSASQFASSVASLSQISPTEKDLGSHNPCWPTSQKGLGLISHSSYNPLPEPAHMSSASQFASSVASLSQISPTDSDPGSHNPCWSTSQMYHQSPDSTFTSTTNLNNISGATDFTSTGVYAPITSPHGVVTQSPIDMDHSKLSPRISSSKLSPSLPNGTSSPPPYHVLIAKALLSSPSYELVLADIYAYALEQYPHLESSKCAWKNSIRHSLSVNNCFVKKSRSPNGRGFFWGIHPAVVGEFKKGNCTQRMTKRLSKKRDVPARNYSHHKQQMYTQQYTGNAHLQHPQ